MTTEQNPVCGFGCSCCTQCGDTYDHYGLPKPPTIEELAQQLVERAAAAGFNVTIEQRPLQPPRMGYHESVVQVWPKRVNGTYHLSQPEQAALGRALLRSVKLLDSGASDREGGEPA